MKASGKACIAIAFSIGLLGLIPWIGNPLISREQELRVVLTARDMARGGSWLVPHYLGEPRLNKPPLMYWVTAGVFKLTGTTQSPALARLPAALFGALLLVTLVVLGRHLVGRTAAFLGAVVTGTTYLFLYLGRLCETDIPLACLETAAVLALYKGLTDRTKHRWWMVSAVAAGLGFLIKGPAAIVLPLAAMASFLAVSPDVRSGFRFGRLAVWLAIVVLIGAPWYLLVYFSPASQAAAFVDMGNEIGALVKNSRHAGSPVFYLYTLPLAMLPWGLLLPFSLATLWPLARRHATIRFLLAWLLSSLVLMSIVQSKQIHYSTLLLAPSALLIGAHLRMLKAPRVIASACLIILLLAGLYAWKLHEIAEPGRIVKDFASQANGRLTARANVFLAGRRLNTMQYYLDRRIERVQNFDEAWRAAQPGDGIILASDLNNPIAPQPVAEPDPVLVMQQNPVVMRLYIKHSELAAPPGGN
jgi:4-amino-4-deoxy-L-arabinose transferase-like glycosyltransferase